MTRSSVFGNGVLWTHKLLQTIALGENINKRTTAHFIDDSLFIFSFRISLEFCSTLQRVQSWKLWSALFSWSARLPLVCFRRHLFRYVFHFCPGCENCSGKKKLKWNGNYPEAPNCFIQGSSMDKESGISWYHSTHHYLLQNLLKQI